MKKSTTTYQFGILLLFVGISLFAQFNAADENAAFRFQLDRMLAQPMPVPGPAPASSVSPNRWTSQEDDFNSRLQKRLKYSEMKQKAIRARRWDHALEYALEARENRNNGEPSINLAEMALELSMLYWNTNDKYNAEKEMERCVYILKNAPKIYRNGYERAEVFYDKMQQGELPNSFSSDDFLIGPNYLLGFVLEIAKIQWWQGTSAVIARNKALGSYFDSMKQSYQYQADAERRTEIRSAEYEYYKKTKKEFDPNNRPREAAAQSAWDSCKRIYDIFCK